MRFTEILEAETPAERRARRNGQPIPAGTGTKPERKVYAVGDSLGVGLKSSNNIPGEATGGYTTAQVLGVIKSFVKNNDVKGAIVIVSSGASNSAPVEFKDGRKQSGDLRPVNDQLKVLKDAGAIPILIGTGSGMSGWFKGKYGEYRVNLTGANERLASIADSNGVKFTGPAEDLDPGFSKGDKIHMSGTGYKNVYNKALELADSQSATPAVPPKQSGQQPAEKVKPAEAPATSGALAVPDNLWKSEETRAIQQALVDLGYNFPRSGVDGYFGPETAGVVRQFQKDNGLKVDGDPGPDTVAALNKQLKAPGPINKKKKPVVPAKPSQSGKINPAPSQATGKGKNIVSKESVSAYLKSKGMSDNHRIGILANIQGESGFDSANQTGDDGTAWGLFQWRLTRQTNMVKYVGPDWKTDWQGQIDFALQEPEGRRYLSAKFKTYEQAVEQWVRDFERPKNPWADTVKRIEFAHTFARMA
jgi:peptidoglycan hydrolase-like protein with peptidoglycan-binding domain